MADCAQYHPVFTPALALRHNLPYHPKRNRKCEMDGACNPDTDSSWTCHLFFEHNSGKFCDRSALKLFSVNSQKNGIIRRKGDGEEKGDGIKNI